MLPVLLVKRRRPILLATQFHNPIPAIMVDQLRPDAEATDTHAAKCTSHGLTPLFLRSSTTLVELAWNGSGKDWVTASVFNVLWDKNLKEMIGLNEIFRTVQ